MVLLLLAQLRVACLSFFLPGLDAPLTARPRERACSIVASNDVFLPKKER